MGKASELAAGRTYGDPSTQGFRPRDAERCADQGTRPYRSAILLKAAETAVCEVA